MRYKLIFAVICTLSLSACGGGGSTNTSSNTGTNSLDSSSAFPSGLALTSPTAVNGTSSASKRIVHKSASSSAAGGPSYSAYVQATEQLSGLLDGSVTVATAFDKETFLKTATNAACFGPTLLFSGHPDDPSGITSGQLPSGDLGIWNETESVSGGGTTACATAQIDRRMQGVSDRTNQALVTVAALIKAANDNSISAPSAGSSVDLTSELGAALVSEGVTVTGATIALDSGGATWSYSVTFSFTGADTYNHDVVISMQHTVGAGTYEYAGLITYQVDDVWDTAGNCGGTDRTYNGTVYYKRTSETAIQINAREGMYCGLGVTGAKAADSAVTGGTTYLLLDPATTHGSDSTGWADNFSILGAEFDPTTTEGHYTYAWQAGENDGYARIFSIGINYNATTSLVDGEAYYGFGDDIGTTDGAITGFFCNWAGPRPPGSPNTLHDYAQRQSFEYNGTSGTFDVPTGGSDITYAPRNTCTYGTSDTAGFVYDRDLDGDLSDEDAATAQVDTGGTVLIFDLMTTSGATDANGDGVIDIEDKMLSRGWVQPLL